MQKDHAPSSKSGAAGHINPGGFVGYVHGGDAAATTDMGAAPGTMSGVGDKIEGPRGGVDRIDQRFSPPMAE